MTEAECGDFVARAVWKWLQLEKRVQFVPWVLDPTSKDYDPIKAGRQQERQEMLESLEETIKAASAEASKR